MNQVTPPLAYQFNRRLSYGKITFVTEELNLCFPVRTEEGHNSGEKREAKVMTHNYFLLGGIIILLYMTFIYLLSLIKKNAALVDIAWGLGFILIIVTFYLMSWLNNHKLPGGRQLLTTLMITAWGIRLSWHIYQRNKGRPEDYRYAAWRQNWGKNFALRSYFQIFLLQGIFMFLIILPGLLIIKSQVTAWSLLDSIGLLIWIMGFLFEAKADEQLKKFKQNPENKGKIMRTGLWRYSRHPNYFGESVMWWGIFILGLNAPSGWIGVISPLTITFLLLKVSGIPLLEKKYQGNPEFEAYKTATSAFFPWPPKKLS
ncbi:MAG: DUF1295 domain-containing protein [Candidatus Saccharicenans sp.]